MSMLSNGCERTTRSITACMAAVWWAWCWNDDVLSIERSRSRAVCSGLPSTMITRAQICSRFAWTSSSPLLHERNAMSVTSENDASIFST
jgi:hypothetical protein